MRRDQAVDDPPMFPFVAVEHMFHHMCGGVHHNNNNNNNQAF
jgi:hypothetical protein